VNGAGQISRRIPQEPRIESALIEVEEELASWAVSYESSTKGLPRVANFDVPNASPRINDLVLRIVERFQPVHPEQVTAFVKDVQGFNLMSQVRKEAVNRALKSLVDKHEIIRDRHGFYCTTENCEIFVRAGNPRVSGSVRKAAHVSPDEVKLAIFWLVKDARAIDESELTKRVRTLFGWARTGNDIGALIGVATRELLANGDVAQETTGRFTASLNEFPDLS